LKCERDLSNLTLSDQEQRELYEAAQIIQKAYRSYAGRKKASFSAEAPYEKEKEARAAVIIQNYYRRYKQVRSPARQRHRAKCAIPRISSFSTCTGSRWLALPQ